MRGFFRIAFAVASVVLAASASRAAANDKLNARNGKKETVDCGSGKKDAATVDKRDKTKGCEKVERAKK
jgi:hypothetical protein